jgi:ligand-binding sensor domain-containing protein/signal transduction histidine kinase
VTLAPRLFLIAAVFLLRAAAASPEPPPHGLDPAKSLGQYGLDAWTTEKGLPQSTVTAILQSRNGYLWVGTYDGLARFDGLLFTVYHKGNTPGLASNGVRSLTEDAQGRLWIGTNGGGLSVLDGGRFRRYVVPGGSTDQLVWALQPAREGGVWLGTNAGSIYRMQDGQFTSVLKATPGEPVGAIVQDRNGELWAATHGGGLKRRSLDGTWRRYGRADGLPTESISALLEDHQGVLWVGTIGGGLARRDGERFESLNGERLPSDIVWSLQEDQRGTLWIGTGGGGLARRTAGGIDVLTTALGLPDAVVYSIREDREGSLWAGTNAGLARLRDGQFTTYTTREGLSNDYVYVSFEDGAGTVWAGTSAGLDRFRDGAWSPEPGCRDPARPAVRSLAEDAQGRLWVGTYGGGVCVRDRDRWSRYTTRDGVAHDSVRAVLADAGGVWVGTVGGLSRFAEGRWSTYTTREGLPSNSVVCLREEPGGVWVGTDGGGLARLHDGRAEVFTTRNGLASDVILALFRDRAGALWVGTNGGLSWLRGGRFSTFTTRDGLPSDSVTQILEDDSGHLWIGTSRGVSRLSRPALEERARGGAVPLDVQTYDAADGMKSRQCTTPAQPPGGRTRDGRLWFATAKGLAIVDPRTVTGRREPPPVLIESVLADDQVLAPPGPLTVAAGTRRLAFDYAGLSLTAPDRVRFRFRLDGFDPEWVDASDRRRASYTAVPPGRYRFRVAARAEGGDWGAEEAEIELALAPHLYQTAWFRALVVITAALAVGLGAVVLHRARVRSLEVRHAELAALVDERTRGLRDAKERAEALGREAERQRRLAEEANELKTELLGMAAHDLRNPLQAIAGFSEVLSGPGTDADTAEMAGRIHEAAWRMIALIEDLLATAAVDRGELALDAAEVDLDGVVGKVLDGLGPMAEGKGQRMEFVAEPGARVRGDSRRLSQVVENLVSNALKFSPRGAAVSVRVRVLPETVRVEVQDEGPGLQPKDFERLFGRFARLSAYPTGGEPSTGLGLSIVKQLVDLHGGRVWAESVGPGAGSIFAFELPRVA